MLAVLCCEALSNLVAVRFGSTDISASTYGVYKPLRPTIEYLTGPHPSASNRRSVDIYARFQRYEVGHNLNHTGICSSR
jgi:hypothetical protein